MTIIDAQDDYEKVFLTLKKKLDEGSKNPESILLGIILCCDLGLYDEAEKLWNESFKEATYIIDENSGISSTQLISKYVENAKIYEANHHYSFALQDLEKAKKLDFGNREVRLFLARLHLKLDDNKKAETEFKSLIDDPHEDEISVRALLELGILYFKKTRKEEAYILWEKAKKIESSSQLKISFPSLAHIFQ